jgi:predicted  nucleic acid-binding Zn-ribbon protein
MDPQLETIIMLQELDLMIAEATDKQSSKQFSDMGFSVENLDRLQTARSELTRKVDRDNLRLYDRLSKRYSHRVVPVQNSVCLGCFMAQPTQFSSDGNTKLRSCQSCSRILYSI